LLVRIYNPDFFVRGVASANIIATDFNPLKIELKTKRTIGSAHIIWTVPMALDFNIFVFNGLKPVAIRCIEPMALFNPPNYIC